MTHPSQFKIAIEHPDPCESYLSKLVREQLLDKELRSRPPDQSSVKFHGLTTFPGKSLYSVGGTAISGMLANLKGPAEAGTTDPRPESYLLIALAECLSTAHLRSATKNIQVYSSGWLSILENTQLDQPGMEEFFGRVYRAISSRGFHLGFDITVVCYPYRQGGIQSETLRRKINRRDQYIEHYNTLFTHDQVANKALGQVIIHDLTSDIFADSVRIANAVWPAVKGFICK